MSLGLIIGAADDDPSAIGYASAGATLGLSFLWTASVTPPMMGCLPVRKLGQCPPVACSR